LQRQAECSYHLLYAFDLNVKSVFCWEGNIVTAEEKKAWATEQLVLKNNELGRLPKKEDFDVVTLSRIKAFLGPWPRALEAAGLKEPRTHVPQPRKTR